ncbi:zinc finger protein 624-like [Cylas formicarius]|uniref:zinc finger protein 624-like n=1 Tax=Cylas formicarius TaxID=197179 RepID=UPI0029588699|nr:zinc finger protein 624-like [Cylas formicarius]XP_060525090.1 zinc finger protein 624-like [Cylas formicarius]
MNEHVNITYKDFPYICRICLTVGDLKPIVDSTSLKIFNIVTEIEIKEDDDLPKNLCVQCMQFLHDILDFANKCKNSDGLLKSALEKEKNKDYKSDSNDNFDEDYQCEDDDEDDEVKSEDLNFHIKEEDDDWNCKKIVKKKRGRKRKVLKEKPIRQARKRGPKPKHIDSENEENLDDSSSKIPVCSACCNTFTSKAKLCQHYKENESCRPKNFKLFKCEVCEKEFSTIRRRNEHMNIHTGETPYICTYCGKGFQLYPAHFKHVYRHRLALGEVELKPGYTEKRVRLNLKCDLCPKVFASRSGFANHLLIHQGVKIQYKKRTKKEGEVKLKNYLCNYCAKSFHTKVQLDGHIRGHTGERPFSCSFCGKYFKTKAALKTHEQNHLGTTPKRFECDICNKPFSLKAHYEVHKRTHTGEKPFSCHFCGKCFNYRGTWRIHLRIHTGETPYACPVCGNRYHDKSSLNKHQKKKNHEGKAIVQEKLLL